MGLYIVANIDGNVIVSVDGLEWSAPFNTGVSIGKVAVGPNKIVYTGVGGEGGEGISSGLFYTSSWDTTPTQVEGTEGYQFNEVRYLGNKFVAVGYENVSPRIPAFTYSEDGMNWTMGDIDPGYIAIIGNGNDLEFTDVGYNEVGYFIVGILAGEGGEGAGGEGENYRAGGFYTTDLSQQLGEGNFVTPENFPTDARQLVYAPYPEGGENFGAWSAFSDDSKTWWSTFNEDPSQPWSFITGWDLSQVLFDNVGLQSLTIAEAAIGTLNHEGSLYVVWMLSTTNGQIIWWPHAPLGPFVSVPKPYTTSIAEVNNLNTLQVTFAGTEVINNEKITVSNSSGLTDLDGTYFVKYIGEGVHELHETKELDSPIDASGWAGSYVDGSATVTLSHGTYIDALGYGDGKFFAGNDDEEVFMCSGFNVGGEGPGNLAWVEVEDLNDSLQYWNDVEYGDFDSCNVTYSYDLSPDNPETIPNYRYYGEGNMDTAIVFDEDGSRRSIQRTGYFDYLDACGNRKVVRVEDGETVTDAPETPSVTGNPTGHPTFGQNDNPSTTAQVIPTGNPLVS